ncbi:MAG TPA: HAMP domain-containing protein, partial [Tepidisphaeraceae bacterium]
MSSPGSIFPSTPAVSAMDRYYNRKPWYRRISQRLGLQAKLIITFILLVILALGSFLLLSVKEYQERMIGSLTGEAQQVSLALAALHSDLLLKQKAPELAAVANELVRSSYNIVEVSYFDETGAVMAHRTRKPDQPMASLDIRSSRNFGQAVRTTHPSGEEVVAVVAPIYGPGSGRIVGYVRVGISLDMYHQQVISSARAAGKVGIVVVLLSVPAAWLLVKRIFLPIRLLVSAAGRIAAGDLETRVETDRPDVIGDLARAFNEMTCTVKQHQEALHHANRQ